MTNPHVPQVRHTSSNIGLQTVEIQASITIKELSWDSIDRASRIERHEQAISADVGSRDSTQVMSSLKEVILDS